MTLHCSRAIAVASLLSLLVMPARAQWAVIDAPAIVQLVHEVQTMEQELKTTQDQLTQAKQALQTMTGDRGMARLLAGIPHNYLPSTWAQLTSAMQGGGGYPGLATDVLSAISANAVLTPGRMATLPATSQQQIVSLRQSSALKQALAQEALANASARFASIQTLVDAISAAADQKGILDLHARISAELGMLQNEQTKLVILHQAGEAQEAVNRQRERERVIAGHGSFQSRFQPSL